MDHNVTALRDDDGNLIVFVDGVKMLGQRNVHIVASGSGDGSLVLIMGVPLNRVIMGEVATPPPAYETKDSNVVYAFGSTPPDAPSTDSDAN